MNQIIYNSHSNSDNQSKTILKSKSHKLKTFLRIQFFALVIVSISVVIYYLYSRYELYTGEKVSKNILDNMNITKIYKNNSDYNTENVNQKTIFYKNSSFSVIGSIEIKKLDIYYPILAEANNDSLKIAPCRLAGPMPNLVGNLCIAAHNYKNGTFFSDISKLENRRYNKSIW